MPSSGSATLLELREVTKRFPGVLALDHVSLSLSPGEIHVLLGENGAGKSTLIKVIAGVYVPDEGELLIGGRPVRLHSPRDAQEHGITTVFQELSLVPTLTVEENLHLGAQPRRFGLVDRRGRRRRAKVLLRQIDPSLRTTARVASLPRGAQQIVEIAKGLLKDARIVILDEPTASLTDQDTARLFDLLRRLRDEGRTIVYITHRIREVFEIGDRVSVLRDGRYVGTVEAGAATEGALIEMMTGRSVEAIYPEIPWRPQEVSLRLESLRSRKLKDVTIELSGGEIVGIAGLLGSGKSEVGRACVGLEPLLSGRVVVKGEVFRPNPREALRRGIVYYPPDRRREGLVPPRPVLENVTLGALRDAGLTRGGLIRRGSEQSRVAGIRDLISIRTPDLRRPVLFLSGGNQQKVVLSRAFLRDADVHIFDEPTVGVDVPTRIEIYNYIRRLCERGAGILLISSDLPEVLHLSHRVYVMHDGEVRAELVGEGISEEAVLSRFFG